MGYDDYKDRRAKFNNIAYYIIVAIISLIGTCFLPMIGSTVGLDWVLPDTVVGWIVFVVAKLGIAVVNMLLFYCFMEQAKINVKDNEKYIKAKEMLTQVIKHAEVKPQSPNKWTAKQYLGKGTTLFLGSIISSVGLTQALLTFDLLSFLTYSFTIVMGIIFGFLQMRKAEAYWTDEFYEYALLRKQELEEQEQQKAENSERNKEC